MTDILFIGDPHFSSAPVEQNPELENFLNFLRQLDPEEVETVCFLGDLFEVWLARKRFLMPSHLELMKTLKELADKGIASDLIEGNRDILVRNDQAMAFRDIDEVLHYEIGGHRVRAVHGDLINYKDEKYLKWRRFVRGRFMALMGILSPAFLLNPLARMAEKKLKSTNQTYKLKFPEKLAQQAVNSAGMSDIQVMVVGHFHLKRLMPDPAGCHGVFVPQFTRNGEYLRLRSDGSHVFERYEGWDEGSED